MSRYGALNPGLLLCAVTMCLNAACLSIESVKPTFEYGQIFVPAAATVKGQELRYRGAVLADRAFVSEQSRRGYREFTGSWIDAVGARVKPGTHWPVVVFLHGCSGYSHYTTTVAEYYLALGAIVVAPNSMNRPGRVAMCGNGSMAYRTNLRKQEAEYALQQLSTFAWVDPQRIFLAGQSEGGNAVAAYSGGGFAAHIITGTNCRHNGGAVSAPARTPVLAIKGGDDTTYPEGKCSVGRTIGGSNSIVISGSGHVVVTSTQAVTAIYTFLGECCGMKAGPAKAKD